MIKEITRLVDPRQPLSRRWHLVSRIGLFVPDKILELKNKSPLDNSWLEWSGLALLAILMAIMSMRRSTDAGIGWHWTLIAFGLAVVGTWDTPIRLYIATTAIGISLWIFFAPSKKRET